MRWDTNDPSPPACPIQPQGVGLLDRVCFGVGMTPKQLAKALNLSYRKDVKPLVGVPSAKVADADLDELWHALLRLVNERFGLLMAVREEVNMKLQSDRKLRLVRREAMRTKQ